jgi:hypothetical protein
MAKLNLNFHEKTGRHDPTEDEIVQIGCVAMGVQDIVKTLGVYANGNHDDIGGVCIGVCYALELLMEPVIGYLSNYAGDAPAPEETGGETA